jgi:putative nucleotidyltransferase with HDIG domain
MHQNVSVTANIVGGILMELYADEVWMQFLINLSKYIDSRISGDGRHSSQVAVWVRSTAREMHFCEKEIQSIFWAALLHDIGKISVPDQILRKNGPLNHNEWTVMKLHPTVGANIVSSQKKISHIAPIIHSHQEKYDGSGYPRGLCGDDIPLEARIVSVVDAYDAMTDNRVYRKARSHSDAILELERMGGKHFDPRVVDTFIGLVNPN